MTAFLEGVDGEWASIDDWDIFEYIICDHIILIQPFICDEYLLYTRAYSIISLVPYSMLCPPPQRQYIT